MTRKPLEVTQSQISYHRPFGLQVGVGLFGLVLGAMCLSVFGFFWPTAAGLAQREAEREFLLVLAKAS